LTPDEFPRAFATAFGAQDAAALAALMTETGSLASLTGQWAEGPAAARTALEAEFGGTFARARLVSGKGTLSLPAPGVALLRQRFVVTGAMDETGAELPRFGAMLVVVLTGSAADWRAESLTFSALG